MRVAGLIGIGLALLLVGFAVGVSYAVWYWDREHKEIARKRKAAMPQQLDHDYVAEPVGSFVRVIGVEDNTVWDEMAADADKAWKGTE